MSFLHRQRTTLALICVMLMAAAALVMEARFLAEPETTPTRARPVVAGEASQHAAVGAAVTATTAALSYGYQDFDAQVEAATGTMTPEFAAEYRRTTAAEKQSFTDQQTTQQVRVVGSAVVSATDQKASALLFLDQYLAQAGAGTSVTQYRALVTVVRRDGRWVLSGMETG